ncbi:MAG: GspH/FimT family pseudopilin [Alishewanella agri]|nr:GspH/FimT family pseudopilin [Alishewanella agri]
MENTRNRPFSCAGLTLIELMVTIAVVAIIATVAVPGFNQFLQQHRTSNQAMQLFHSVQYARTEAIRQNSPVRLSAHNAGWCVHTGASCTDVTVLREFSAASQLQSSTFTGMTFDGRGRRTSPATNDLQIRFQPKTCKGSAASLVSINPLGHPTITKGTCL